MANRLSGYFGIDTADTNNFPRRERQFVDTVRWTHGKHQITFGGDYSRGRNDAINNFRANGQWAFGGTSLFTNDGLADFMIGRYNSLTQGVGEYKNTNVTHLGMFFQDSIKLTRRFTIDAGARWEPFFPFTDNNGKLAVWSPGQQSNATPMRRWVSFMWAIPGSLTPQSLGPGATSRLDSGSPGT